MTTRRHIAFDWPGLALAAALAALAGAPAHAQSLGYGDVDSGDAAPSDGSRDGHDGHDSRRGSGHGGSGVRTTIRPYLEVSQSLFARLRPEDETVTWTALAAGVDMQLNGRRTSGAVSVRYERRFVERGRFGDSDTVSGLARVKHDLVPRTLSVEAGGFAARTRVEAGGAANLNTFNSTDSVAQVYSVYAGPALATHAGKVAINASYLVGYSKVDQQRAVQLAPSGARADLFDHSLAQSAQVSAGVRPHDVLPVGLTASAGWSQEDISNLGQRVSEKRAGLQATLPVSLDVALVGDVGWSEVTVSARDALRDSTGAGVIGPDGRYVTDKSAPRRLAYHTNGFVWDVGVMWRPSRRTALSAFVGRRYDSTTYYGSFSYVPDARTSVSVSVVDGISGFGSAMTDAVRKLPTDFETTRNPLSGNTTGCAYGASGGGCVNGPLGSLSSAVYRGRGVTAAIGKRVGRLQWGLGAGYSRRKFIAPQGTVIATANGTVDETWFVDAGVSGPVGRRSSFSVGVYDSWYRNARSGMASINTYGVNAGLSRQFARRLTGSAAVGLEGISRQTTPDELAASGQLGLRYSF